jgi:hypothetical protein
LYRRSAIVVWRLVKDRIVVQTMSARPGVDPRGQRAGSEAMVWSISEKMSSSGIPTLRHHGRVDRIGDNQDIGFQATGQRGASEQTGCNGRGEMLAQPRTIYRTTALGGRKTGKSHMAKDTTGTGAAAPADAKGNGGAPALNVLAQYVKDLSFENPGAPKSLGPRDKAPAININVNVNANPLSETEFDVVLT